MTNKCFRGEVWNNIDEEVLATLVRINAEDVDGKVGHDGYTARATAYLQAQFEKEISVLYAINGTAANIVALKALLHRYGSVITADAAHIHTYECGATEYNLGNKILTVDTPDAKLTPALIAEVLGAHASHGFIPEVVAVTEPTELGTLYTVDELRAIADFAHEKGMKVFLDGARLGSALAALGLSLGEFVGESGVDVFTVGGTKAGAMFGEAVVFTDTSLCKEGEYILKQSLQHFDKSKFLGAQMACLFEGERWVKNFAHANEMAKRLADGLKAKGFSLYLPVESNMVFCVMDENTLARAQAVYDLKYWFADKRVVRIATTFATTAEDVDGLLALL